MIVRIPFNLIRVNQGREGLEVVFPYGEDWYRLDWEKVPDRFKELYRRSLEEGRIVRKE